jgi:hypothetical protein
VRPTWTRSRKGPYFDQSASQSALPDHPEQLRTEAEQTRQRLGETVDQLTAKTDVKARAQAKVADLTQRAKDTVGQVRQQAAAAGETGREQLQARTPDGVKRTAAAGAAGPGKTGRRWPSRPASTWQPPVLAVPGWPWTPRPRWAGSHPTAVPSHGLGAVAALAARWGAGPAGEGQEIWAEMPR